MTRASGFCRKSRAAISSSRSSKNTSCFTTTNRQAAASFGCRRLSGYHGQMDQPLESLKTFLRIPSISADPQHKPDIRRAADFCASELRAAGMSAVELIESERGWNPLVYAEWLNAPGKPTLLLYGHYDVQPPDPLDEWISPPFEPTVRGDNLFARGASDDKGQTYILIKAVESLLRDTGRLPVNVKFLIEGEEETGGEHVSAYVAGN